MRGPRLTLFFKEYTALCNYNRDVAIDVALAMLVEERYGDIRIGYALNEGDAKYAREGGFYAQGHVSVNVCEE